MTIFQGFRYLLLIILTLEYFVSFLIDHQTMKLLLTFCSILLLHLCAGEDTPKWNGTAGGNNCIILQASINFNLTGKGPKDSFNVDVFQNASASSDCSITNYTESLTLSSGNPRDFEFWTLDFLFSGAGNDQYALKSVTVTLKNGEATFTGVVNLPDKDFSAPKEDSFKCKTRQEFNITGIAEWPFTMSKLTLENLQWEAFLNTTKGDFSTAHVCKADMTTNDLVPIIVGACLAALVIIVLIAYLVGRARAKRSTGYESV